MAEAPTEVSRAEFTRYDVLPQSLKVILFVLTIIGIGLFIFYNFAFSIRGHVLSTTMYYYLLYVAFVPGIFLLLPARKKDKNRLPWYDVVLAALLFGICVYFTTKAWSISRILWVPAPHSYAIAFAVFMMLSALESARRMAGIPFFLIILLLGVYPLFAEHMPGVLYGFGFPFTHIASAFAFSSAGMLGLPAQVLGDILLGFLIFAGMMIASGAGTFFINVALALLGRFRGGPAKVAVLASGFFGSLSGAPAANIVTTGSITIPAMKRLGYSAHYAAAIEAVASTGGILMPPVMGTIAFVMAIIIAMPYSVIIVAAIIPAILYYYGLLVQVDSYAARVGLRGLPREEVPSLIKTLKEGWQFVIVILFLVFGLLYMRWGVTSAIYASGLMVILSFTRRETMMTPKRFFATIATVGNLVTYVMSVLLPVGLFLIGLTIPGTLTALTAQIVTLGGTNLPLIILIAVVVCYLFGMVGIAFLAYIVLAVVVAPGLAAGSEMNLLAIHLFLMYYTLIAGITPPVAMSSFIAAALAGAPLMKTAWTSMRLGVVLYFIPFFFLFNPALILQGPILETLYLFALCLVGIWILASGLEGYLLKVGRLKLWSRALFTISGFLIAFPNWMTTIIGVILTAAVIAVILIGRKVVAQKAITGG